MVDINRLVLIRAMGFKSPATVGEERKLFKELHAFLTTAAGMSPDRALEPPAKNKEGNSDAS
jgi:hypothetical protein